MTATWTRLAVRPSAPALRGAVSEALFASGSQGLHEDGEWLVTHLEPGAATAAYVAAVRAADAHFSYETSEVAPVDWTATMRERITAHTLGTLTVAPPWLADGYDPRTTVVIEPAMAFGTGEHATTRGVVRLMHGVVRAGDTVADLGAGSAVLSIAAAKLGAARVVAIELDPDAIGNAEENVRSNGVAERVTVIEGDAAVLLPFVAPVRVVLANIISSVLLELLPVMRAALASDGAAILSGILQEERDRMLAALAEGGWRVLAEDAEEQWWSVAVAPGQA